MKIYNLFFSIQGRISRGEFWSGVAVLTGFYILLALINFMLGIQSKIFINLLVGIVFLFNVILSIKRWHDRNESAWWFLISFVPIVGSIWAFIENGFLKGTEGENLFGEDPLITKSNFNLF